METTASVIIGNPSAPCSGRGVCEMMSTSVNSALAFNVEVSSKGTDLTIIIPTDSLATLQRVRPDVYGDLMSEKPVFNFDKEALPFYLDYYISQKIFPSMGDYNWLDGTSTNTVTKQEDGSIAIYFPKVSPIENGKYGSTGSFDGDSLTSGKWQIGNDVYGNLLFYNYDTNTMFMFGSKGNINANRYSVKLSQTNPRIPSSSNNLQTLIGTWEFGTDSDGNLWITNGVNNIVFTVANIGFVLNNVNIITEYTSTLLTNSELDSSAYGWQIGNWTIQQDTNGNLCFYNAAFSYFFTKDGNIYVGQDIIVETNYPIGG